MRSQLFWLIAIASPLGTVAIAGPDLLAGMAVLGWGFALGTGIPLRRMWAGVEDAERTVLQLRALALGGLAVSLLGPVAILQPVALLPLAVGAAFLIVTERRR